MQLTEVTDIVADYPGHFLFFIFSWHCLQGVLSEEEMCELEKEFMAFLRREVPVEGRDFCDMSADYTKPVESFSIINIMLPSK